MVGCSGGCAGWWVAEVGREVRVWWFTRGGGSRHGLVVLVASAGSVDVVLLPGVDAGRAPGRGPTSGERGWWVLGLPGGKEKRRAGGSTPWWLGQAEVRGGRFTRGVRRAWIKRVGAGASARGGTDEEASARCRDNTGRPGAGG